MSIDVQTLLSEKARRYGASETSEDFRQIFTDNLNYVLSDIAEKLGISLSPVTPTTDSIVLDEQTYRGLISLGIDSYFQFDSAWTTKDPNRIERLYRTKLATVYINYIRTVSLGYKFGDKS